MPVTDDPYRLRHQHRRVLRAAVVERFTQDRMDVHQLAELFATRPAVIRRLLTEAGVHDAQQSCIGLSDQETARVLAEWYEKGASIVALIRKTGIDKRVIRNMLLNAGVSLPARHSMSAAEIEQLAARYGAGESIRDLADSTAPSFGAIRAALSAAGVELRPRGGARSGPWSA